MNVHAYIHVVTGWLALFCASRFCCCCCYRRHRHRRRRSRCRRRRCCHRLWCRQKRRTRIETNLHSFYTHGTTVSGRRRYFSFMFMLHAMRTRNNARNFVMCATQSIGFGNCAQSKKMCASV